MGLDICYILSSDCRLRELFRVESERIAGGMQEIRGKTHGIICFERSYDPVISFDKCTNHLLVFHKLSHVGSIEMVILRIKSAAYLDIPHDLFARRLGKLQTFLYTRVGQKTVMFRIHELKVQS